MLTYFCAACQTRHPVQDIAVDLYDICQSSLKEQIKGIRNTVPKDADSMLSRLDKITYFVNQDARFRRTLHFTRNKLLPRLVDVEKSGNSVKGSLQLDFQWLLDVYKESGAAADDEKAAAAIKKPMCDLSAFPKDKFNQVLFFQDMDFIFIKPTGFDVLVFDRITPGRQNRPNRFTQTSARRVCPHCGKQLSTAVGKAPETVVALAGSPRAGKTSCITAIASGLKNQRYGSFGLSMTVPSNDELWSDLEKQIRNFDEGHIVEKTPKNLMRVPSYSYLLSLDSKQERVMTFVDMPGEFWNQEAGTEDQLPGLTGSSIVTGMSDEFYANYAGLYQNIDCIWLFISKLAVQRVDLKTAENTSASPRRRAFEANQQRLIEETSDSSDTILGSSPAYLKSILKDLESYLVNQNTTRGMPPVAVILTKSEVLCDGRNPDEATMIQHYKLFPAENGKVLSSNVLGKNMLEMRAVIDRRQDDMTHFLQEKEFYERSQLVRNYIAANNQDLLSAVEDSCSRHFYIAMAAYGHPAAQMTEAGTPPTPYHEMYPLLWTLAITDGFNIKHSCRWYTQSGISKLLKLGQSKMSYGTVHTRFHYDKLPNDKKLKKEERQDQQLIHASIHTNLLMDPYRGAYTSTDINHPKR